MSITIKDIARMAGVSIATVSRVINNSKPVNEDVRQRVLEAMEQTKFRPNAIARNLIKNQSFLLGVMLPEVKNTVMDSLIDGINHISRLHGYNVVIVLTGGTLENELHYYNLFREMRVDGIVVATTQIQDELLELIGVAQIPCIMVGRDSRPKSIPSVHVDNFSAAYEAATYLIRQGHRQIGMLRVANGDTAAGKHRFEGFRKALDEAHLPLREEWIIEGGVSVEEGAASMQKICETGVLPTAVFCATDRMAIGAINYLTESNIKVPEDISVFGFDDIDMASIVRPKLSTVSYSATEIGLTAGRNLINLVKGQGIYTMNFVVTHQLKIRDSVRFIK